MAIKYKMQNTVFLLSKDKMRFEHYLDRLTSVPTFNLNVSKCDFDAKPYKLMNSTRK